MSTASWALVKWEEDGRFTVVPAGWVLEPHPLPLREDLPASGLCRWTKRSAKYKVVVLDVSDSKHYLQQRINELVETSNSSSEEDFEIQEDEPKPKKQKHSDTNTSKPTTGHKKTEDKRTTERTKTTQKAALQKKKLADIQTANVHAREIFAKLQTQDQDILREHLDDAKEEISSLKEQLTTAQQQLVTTQQQMTTTQHQLQAVQNEKQSLAKQLEELQTARAVTDNSLIPNPSAKQLAFLKQLVGYYDKAGGSCGSELYETNSAISDDSSLSEEKCDFLERRRLNIEENEWMKEQLGLKKKPTLANPLPSFQFSEITDVVEMMPQKAGKYSYSPISSDLHLEQEAFKPGPNKTELVPGMAVFIDTASLRLAEQNSKASVTGLMRALISVFYPPERLAACSANKGINSTIRTAIFEYCKQKYPDCSIDKLERDLTNKCGEERRKLTK